MGLWTMIIHGATEGEANVADHLTDIVHELQAKGHTVISAQTEVPEQEQPEEPAPAPVEPPAEAPVEEPAPTEAPAEEVPA